MKKKTWIRILAGVLLLAGSGLGQAYQVGPVNHGGTIQGRVAFAGSPPAPTTFIVDKNPEVCGEERSLVKVETHNGFLAGAVVVVEGITEGKPFPERSFSGHPPGEGAFQYQGGNSLGLRVKTKGCNFGPLTGVISADEAIQFENQDSIKHTLHTFAARDSRGIILRTIHNQDIHPQDTIERTFDSGKLRDSHVVRITCNRHDFMQNWLYVVEHPYFALTDREGRFAIDRIPAGIYTILVWHPNLGEQRQEVTITEQREITLNFRFGTDVP